MSSNAKVQWSDAWLTAGSSTSNEARKIAQNMSFLRFGNPCNFCLLLKVHLMFNFLIDFGKCMMTVKRVISYEIKRLIES